MTLASDPGVTEDRLLGGRVRLAQAAQGYRVAIDPVLLAAAVPAKCGETVLDLGCGSGAAALCLLARVAGLRATGLESDPETAALAARNAGANSAAGANFAVFQGDVLAPPAALREMVFDQVLMNPPYLDPQRSRLPTEAGRRRSHAEAEARLGDWLDLGLRRLREKGYLTLIHRAERLDEILSLLAGRAGGILICPLWPGPGVPAKRVIVRARKGARAPLVLHPGLVLHGPEGRYTPEAEAVLRGAAPLIP